MTSTLQKRLLANYEEGINECRNGLAKVCRILLKGVPVADKLVGLSNTEKKKLGFNASQIAQIESGLPLNKMDVTLLNAIIRAFGGIGPGILHDRLKQFKDIRNDFCHEKQNLSFSKAELQVKLTELKDIFREIFEELKSHCDPSLSPSLDHDIVDLETRLTSLEKTIDDELPEITEALKKESARALANMEQFNSLALNAKTSLIETSIGAQNLKQDISQATVGVQSMKQDIEETSAGAQALEVVINQSSAVAKDLKQDVCKASTSAKDLGKNIVNASTGAQALEQDIKQVLVTAKSLKQDIKETAAGTKCTLNRDNDTLHSPVILEDKDRAQPQQQEISSLLENAIEKDNAQTTLQTLDKICKWIKEKKINYEEHIKYNKFYPQFVALFKENTIQGNPKNALHALKKLLNLGIANNHPLIESMEKEILRNLRKGTIQMALHIMTFQINYQDTELQQEVLRETVSTIERRWVEIKGPELINVIVYHHNQFLSDFIERIEDHTIKLANDLSAEDLCRIFCNIGKSQRRPNPLLKSLAYHIDKHSETLTPRKLANLLFALNRLNFVDTDLLNRIAKDLISQIQVIEQSTVVGNVFTSIGQLRWRNTSLIECLSEWVKRNLDCCRIIDLAAFVRTIASISYCPSNFKILLLSIIPKLKKEEVNTETDWLDIVWSLVTLGKASAEQVASTLSQTSNTELNACTTTDCPKKGLKLKLLNINAYAQHIMKSAYCGPYLNLADQDDVTVPQSQSKSKLSKYLQQIFYKFLPSRFYISVNIQTSMGIFVDVELSVDKDGTPIPVYDFTTHFGKCESLKPLPDGAFRVAIFVCNYKDYDIDTQELLGFNKLAVKLVSSVGYKVVNIPYNEIDIRKDPSNYVEYLNNKIKLITFENCGKYS